MFMNLFVCKVDYHHQTFNLCYLDPIRLGFIIDYLSKATLIGFMAGAAVIVSMQQLKGLLGIVHFAGKTQIIPVVSSVFHERREVSYKMTIYAIELLNINITLSKYSYNLLSLLINLDSCAVELADHCYGLQFLTVLTNSKVNCKLLMK